MTVICFIIQVCYQDENRYSVSRGAHKNLRRAERARIMVSRMPGIYNIYNIMRWKQCNLSQLAAISRVLTFNGCSFPALVDLLIKMTRSWEEERNKVFLFDQVTFLTFCNTLN